MADKIVVLSAGRIEQVGSPIELYSRPRNRFVAGFIGSPRMNFIEGEDARREGADCIGIRPEHLVLSTESGRWSGSVTVSEHLGSDTFLYLQVDGIGTMVARAGGEFPARHGDRVWLTPQAEKLHRFDAQGNALLPAGAGAQTA